MFSKIFRKEVKYDTYHTKINQGDTVINRASYVKETTTYGRGTPPLGGGVQDFSHTESETIRSHRWVE